MDYDPSIDNTSLAVISVVGAASQTDLIDLKPLHSVIDSSALDTLFSGSGEGYQVTFEYAGLSITVDGSGVIECRHSNGDMDG
ncbi:hypothetical protein CP557_07460 [Natrinema ejinorense]|uniref:Halobacterial output domain-containing protein n=1 Tax=Natrinema ejinorense TaxID=373386 RepID=A0A2A5R0M7_9EURY|nr:hypothetical protein CP557_07460 [Natrinema ejinorense]